MRTDSLSGIEAGLLSQPPSQSEARYAPSARLNELINVLQCNAELRTGVVGVNDEPRLFGQLCSENRPSTTLVYVVGDDRAARDRLRCLIELEPNVTLGVAAVVDKEVDRPDLVQQLRQSATARARDVGPARPKVLGHCESNLVVQARVHRWEVDAPKVPCACALKGLENHPRGDAMGDPSLHNLRRSHVDRQTPHGPGQPRICVVPAAIRRAPKRQTPGTRLLGNLRPELLELTACGARPVEA